MCPKTCGLCTDAPTVAPTVASKSCADNDMGMIKDPGKVAANCAAAAGLCCTAAAGYCENAQWATLVRKNCPLTCGLCTSGSTLPLSHAPTLFTSGPAFEALSKRCSMSGHRSGHSTRLPTHMPYMVTNISGAISIINDPHQNSEALLLRLAPTSRSTYLPEDFTVKKSPHNSP